MTNRILSTIVADIKQQYDFIPYANWDEKGERPAPFANGQTYPEDSSQWKRASQSQVGIRLNNLVLVDYDGNKPEAVGEIPSTDELATALGYSSAQELFDKSLVQWNEEMTSLHFLFVAPPEFNTTDFKQSNQGTSEHFWKHIDIKTGNQLVYIKERKRASLRAVKDYDQTPSIVMDQLRDKSQKTLAEDFDYEHLASTHQQEQAQLWLSEQLCTLSTMPEDSGRNSQLNIIACTASGLIAGGALANQETYTELFTSAIESGLSRSEVINTLQSAWNEGYKTPRRDAPYTKPCTSVSEVFDSHAVNDTNIDIVRDCELTRSVNDGDFDPNDPNIGILFEQYRYLRDNYVMNAESRYINKNNLSSYNARAFDQLHTSLMPAIPGSKKFKKFAATDVFEAAQGTVVTDIMYMPGKETLFTYDDKLYLNSYKQYTPERPDQSKIDHVRNLIDDHLNWLFEEKEHQNMMLDWLAWQVQHPGKLVGWLPLVIGCRGDGKSVLFELITAGMSHSNTKLITNNSVKSDFQNWAIGSTVTCFEEIKIEGRESRRIANDLKPFITEKRVTINPKGSAEVTVPNTTNYVAFSNESDAISIALGDRRWFVLHTRHFGLNTVTVRTQTDMKEHFDSIKDLVNHEENYPAVYHALLEHEISDTFFEYRFRAPQTVFSQDLVEETASEKENRLEEYLQAAYFNDGREGRIVDYEYGFQIQDFRMLMPETWFQGMDKKPSAKLLGKWLRNLGYEYTQRTLPDGGKVKSFKRG